MSRWTAYTEPPAPHPFPHAVANDEWVLVSGIVGIRPDGSCSSDAGEQTRQALENLRAILSHAGSALSEVVYLKPYVSDRRFIPDLDRTVRAALPEPRPASAALTVVGLADERFLVEFDAWAHRGAELCSGRASADAPDSPNS